MARPRPAAWLALNGVLLMFTGLLVGAAIPLAPYPRLMLSAHNAGFTVSGMLSIVAALLLSSSLCSIPGWATTWVIWAHVALWPLSFSEVAGAFWGTKRAIPLAAAEAGAPGGTPWQEMVVIVCHIVPALLLMVAWAILVWGTWRVFRGDRFLPQERNREDSSS
jgi:hypothetical protein